MNDVRLYEVQNGDIFSLSISAFAQTSMIWNNPNFIILSVKQIRPQWFVTVFRKRIAIPKPYKMWFFQIMYKTEV